MLFTLAPSRGLNQRSHHGILATPQAIREHRRNSMPALANPKHERFARHWLKTQNASAAYRKAGYAGDNPNAVAASASRLLKTAKVQSRIKEIRRQMATRTRITLETLLHDLAEDRALARETKQVSAAIAATQLSAKLVGLLIDRKESGGPGDFADMSSADEILAKVRTDLGDEFADALAGVLSKQEAEDVGTLPLDQAVGASSEPSLTHDGSDAVN
jgi:hypothetical protein